MVHREGIVLVQMHLIQRKQFSETNPSSHALNKLTHFRFCFFLNASAGY